ncbi:hypothetical protein LTS08_004644 [Lithohypha guttulata]|nr:hypothetical protein LTS08_004644 [Lithohypha guttulata]
MAAGSPVLITSNNLLICNACGTQFPVEEGQAKEECKICDPQDPRQFVPPEGQTFTTLATLRQNHKNIWWQDKRHPYIWSVRTEPKFAISNRAELIQTPHGNVLMDLIPFLDQETIDRIMDLGGLEAIVISHPHYYSTWADWSRTFKCPIYVGTPDKEWLERLDTPDAEIRFLPELSTPILLRDKDIGMNAIVTGGHFPGSLLLHYKDVLFIADTIFAVPSATDPVPGRPGKISFTFWYSVPNRIPLDPDEMLRIWRIVKDLDFQTAIGAFEGMDIYTMDNEKGRTGGVKGRILESCRITTKAMGWKEHAIFSESS